MLGTAQVWPGDLLHQTGSAPTPSKRGIWKGVSRIRKGTLQRVIGYRGVIGGYKGYVGLGGLEFRVLSFYLLTSRIMLKVMMMMMMIKEQLSRPSSPNGSFPSLYIP